MENLNMPSATTSSKQSLVLRLSIRAGIVGPILYTLVFTLDGAFRPDYSPYRDAVSYLLLGSNGWIEVANYIVLGLLLIFFAFGFFQWMRPVIGSGRLYASTVLLVISGLGFIMAALFLPDPVGVLQHSINGIMHNVAFTTVFFPLGVVCLLIGSRFWRTAGWRTHSWYGLIIGLPLSLAALASLIFPQKTPPPWGGLFERGFIVIAFAWVVILASRMLMHRGGWNQ